MMDVGIVRVTVGQRFMRMRVGVRFLAFPVEIMQVLVMGIVNVPMGVGDRLMRMHVLVALGQV